jgi:hypothetical protein
MSPSQVTIQRQWSTNNSFEQQPQGAIGRLSQQQQQQCLFAYCKIINQCVITDRKEIVEAEMHQPLSIQPCNICHFDLKL